MINLPTVPGDVDLPPVDGIPHKLDEAEGEHGEIHAPQPQRQRADKVGQDEACSTADRNDDRQGKVGAEQGRGIDTHAEKGRRGEGYVTGRPREDGPAERQDHVHEDVGNEDDRVSDDT